MDMKNQATWCIKYLAATWCINYLISVGKSKVKLTLSISAYVGMCIFE